MIDTPPSIGAFTEAVLNFADVVVAPVPAGAFALQGLSESGGVGPNLVHPGRALHRRQSGGAHTRHPADHGPEPVEELERNAGRLTDANVAEVEAVLEAADGFSLVTGNDLTDEGLEQVGALVRSRGRLLAVHAAEAPGYRTISMSRTGRADVPRVLEHLRPDFVVHLTTATADEIDAVAKARVPAVVCPRIQGVMGLGVPRFDWMLERGMLVALGTDNLMLCGPDLLRELEYSSRVVRAIRTSATYPSARQLLQMVTVNPARILGRDREIGSLERGKLADVVVFDAGSPNLRPVRDPVATIVNRADSRDIAAVLREGRVAHGRLATSRAT